MQQGSDPLEGTPARTGIIGTADTPGSAVDVCALNDFVAVADSGRGVAVFNIFNRMSSAIIAQIDTPGSALAVACAGNLIAVADGDAGLAIIDMSSPPQARIVRQVELSAGGSAHAVAVADGIAYVGVGARFLVAVDLASGAVLGQLQLGALQDIVVNESVLYALSVGLNGSSLHTLSLQDGALQVTASVNASGVARTTGERPRLFVGGGLAYAVHNNGYNTFDLSDPLQPVLIAEGSTGQAGWKQIVVNGSGLGLAAVGANVVNDGTHHLSLYDVRDPAVTDAFLTTFTTPGFAAAVTLYNGLAYVADSTAGLQVINYLAADTQGVPPTITLRTVGFAPEEAEENTAVEVTAQTSDDVQVRNVEFYLDSVKVATDGNFPFTYRFLTPRLAKQASFTIRARASDTGGNVTWSETLVVQLTPDTTPPQVLQVTPRAGSALVPGTVDTLTVRLSEAIDPATLTTTSFQVFAAGPDGLPDTADDVLLTDGNVAYDDATTSAVLHFASPLPPATYWAVLGTALTDQAGNALAAPVTWTFRLVRVDLTTGGSLLGVGTLDLLGAQDVYTFIARPGQQLYFDSQDGEIGQGWRLTDSDGQIVFTSLFNSQFEPGLLRLERGGTYTITAFGVQSVSTPLGNYRFQVWTVPAPQTFTIALGDVVSDGVPGPGAGRIETPGAQDVYTFTATPGQTVYFDEQSGNRFTSPIFWQVTDEAGTLLVDEVLGDTSGRDDAGLRTLERGGTYTITIRGRVGDDVGAYQFQVIPQ